MGSFKCWQARQGSVHTYLRQSIALARLRRGCAQQLPAAAAAALRERPRAPRGLIPRFALLLQADSATALISHPRHRGFRQRHRALAADACGQRHSQRACWRGQHTLAGRAPPVRRMRGARASSRASVNWLPSTSRACDAKAAAAASFARHRPEQAAPLPRSACGRRMAGPGLTGCPCCWCPRHSCRCCSVQSCWHACARLPSTCTHQLDGQGLQEAAVNQGLRIVVVALEEAAPAGKMTLECREAQQCSAGSAPRQPLAGGSAGGRLKRSCNA